MLPYHEDIYLLFILTKDYLLLYNWFYYFVSPPSSKVSCLVVTPCCIVTSTLSISRQIKWLRYFYIPDMMPLKSYKHLLLLVWESRDQRNTGCTAVLSAELGKAQLTFKMLIGIKQSVCCPGLMWSVTKGLCSWADPGWCFRWGSSHTGPCRSGPAHGGSPEHEEPRVAPLTGTSNRFSGGRFPVLGSDGPRTNNTWYTVRLLKNDWDWQTNSYLLSAKINKKIPV